MGFMRFLCLDLAQQFFGSGLHFGSHIFIR